MKDLIPKVKIENSAVIRNWLKGLRSGKYSQIRNRLHILGTNKFCALGVFYFQNNINMLENNEYSYVSLVPANLMTEVIRFNDTENKNFLEIADWIERNCEVE